MIGEKLLVALMQYTFYLQQIEQELVLNHGWLKPYKMKELAGAPALDKQQKELELKKRDERMTEIKEKMRKISVKHVKRESLKGTSTIKLPHVAIDEMNESLSGGEKSEWRDFFTEEEMDEAYQSISIMKLLPESENSSEHLDSNSSSGDSYRIDSLPPITHKRRLSYKERISSEKSKKKKKKRTLNASNLKPNKKTSTSLERNESLTPNQFSISPMRINNLSSEKVYLSPYHGTKLSDLDSNNQHASSFDDSHPIVESSLKYPNCRPSSRNAQKLASSLQTMKLIPTRSNIMNHVINQSRLLEKRKFIKPVVGSARNKNIRLEDLLSITNSNPETRTSNTSRPESELDHINTKKISLYSNLAKQQNLKQKMLNKPDSNFKRNFIIQSVKVQLLPITSKKPNASTGKMVFNKS